MARSLKIAHLADTHGIANVAVIEKGWIGGGNAGRNTIPGLPHSTFNLNFRRTFRLGNEASQRTLAFQLNTQNVLNHPTISSFGTNVSAYTFGIATGASQMRTVSMNLRFTF